MNKSINMKKLILCLFVILSFSCKKEIVDSYAIPKSMNLGYLFDSLEYEKEKSLFTCDGNHDSIYNDGNIHKGFCRLYGYIPYKESKYVGVSMDSVYSKEGSPKYSWTDLAHYGYIWSKEYGYPHWEFVVVDFIDQDPFADEVKLVECQEVYRIQKLLNDSTCIVHHAIWRNSERYLSLWSLKTDSSNQVFYGFQAPPYFGWPE